MRKPRTEQCTNKRDFYQVCEAEYKTEGLFIRFVRQNKTKQRDFSSGWRGTTAWSRAQTRGIFSNSFWAEQNRAQIRGIFLTVFGQSRTEHKQDVFFRRHHRT